MRVSRFVVVLIASFGWWSLAPTSAWAQAPPTGPLVLHLPTSARTAALGNAWVAGRDLDVIFHNPAQIVGTRSTIDLSVARLGPASTMLSAGSIYAAGKWSLTLGWGAQVVGFNADGARYPFSPDVTLASGSRSGTSARLTAGAAIVFKKFRIGAAVKYVSDMASTAPAVFHPVRVNQHLVLADVGVARNLFGGAAAIAFQNIGRDSRDEGVPLRVPRQVAIGWSATKVAGPLDLAVFTQVAARRNWTAPAAGLEAGYSWIEGYTLTLRAGVRRPETLAEKPIALGAALTADRLTVEYALRLFDGGRSSNGVTLRWR
jgi:hypothetical protein